MAEIIIGERVTNTIEFGYGSFEVKQAYRKLNQDVDDELYQYIVKLGKQLKLEMDSIE